MQDSKRRPKLLVIEDEAEWQHEISEICNQHRQSEIVILPEYRKADQFVTAHELDSFDAAIIDVRLRKQIYDQGGLTILDLLKRRRRDIPVLMLTAYSYDYPGLTGVTERYPRVLTYDKDVFKAQPDRILSALLADLPPQIGSDGAKMNCRNVTQDRSLSAEPQSSDPLREILVGGLVVGFVLAAVVLFFLISESFPENAGKLNIVFAVLVVVLICVLIRIFNPDIVSKAIQFYKSLIGSKGTVAAGGQESIKTTEPNKAIDSDEE